jgi:hypothetical protein
VLVYTCKPLNLDLDLDTTTCAVSYRGREINRLAVLILFGMLLSKSSLEIDIAVA